MPLDSILAEQLPDMPRLANYGTAAQWRKDFDCYLDTVSPFVFSQEERLYKCDKCKDTDFVVTRDEKGLTWAAPCNHANRGDWARPFFGMPEGVTEVSIPDVLFSRVRQLPCRVMFSASPPKRALGMALRAARDLHKRKIKCRYFDALSAPSEFGTEWEMVHTKADCVIIGNVDVRLSAPKVAALTDSLHMLKASHYIVAATDMPKGGRWDALRLALKDKGIEC